MSAQTKAELDAAIAAHIADEQPGAIVAGYAMVVANQSLEDLDHDRMGYYAEYSDDQHMHTSLGLVAHHHERLLHLCRRGWTENED